MKKVKVPSSYQAAAITAGVFILYVLTPGYLVVNVALETVSKLRQWRR